MRALEDALATRLFKRAAKGLVLTEAGAALVEPARAMQEAAMRMQLTAAGREEGLAGTVRITAPEAVSLWMLPEVIAKVRRAEPEIQIELAPNDALSFGLAIHELATNASKYGALSCPGGTITVDWSVVSDEVARVEWIERGGPPVAQDRKRGFGTELIEKIVAHELKHPVELDFEPQGVRCVLQVPIRKPSAFAMRAQRRGEGS